jgi:hypothetical protein
MRRHTFLGVASQESLRRAALARPGSPSRALRSLRFTPWTRRRNAVLYHPSGETVLIDMGNPAPQPFATRTASRQPPKAA